ncbi:UNVERIFIED_CONTAM: hypothetical protein NCL1_25520 [Trichonephila clavipes]
MSSSSINRLFQMNLHSSSDSTRDYLCYEVGIQSPDIIWKLCSLFSEALEDARHGLQVLSYNDENSLGAYLNLYASYIDSEKEMLSQRTNLLVEYENANKALDKAKPHKKQGAEEAKLAAEKAFEDCSDVARQEVTTIHAF